MKNISLEERFKRQTCLAEVGIKGQESLLNSKILVVGAGGLGSPVIAHLAMMGIGNIGICDDDVVDITNLHRQGLFGESDVGKRKVEIAQKRIKEIFSRCHVETYDLRIDCFNTQEIAEKYDLVIDCTDNFKTKFLLHDACYLLKKNLIQSSLYQFEGHVHTFQFSENNKDSLRPCLRCLWPEVIDESCTGSCAEVGVLGVAPAIFGSFQALEAVKLLLGLETLKQGETYTLDLLNLSSFRHSWQRDEYCVLCSDHAQIRSLNPSFYQTVRASFELRKEDIHSKDFICFDIRSCEEIKKAPLPLLLGMPVHPYIGKEGIRNEMESKKKYIFICEKGIRSKRLVEELRKDNFKDCYSLYGGRPQS